ncbi:MAG TPA: bifunctional phosphopantothenoylcysteine decarboxylase/phosphopantothenate--cysteine ligase CoaBC [Gammaproteobacteria bacterium]|nr:bifunctional phosphopantothenoylcysteine decarboxylase/phosphopantothenate--cysteine ligase CoaBC [Gammaproteobacteria bacterium]
MDGLHHKRVLLGVTGGIAAYKSAELVRRLREAGAEVRVVMSQSATGFITPLTFQALSGHPVRTALNDAAAEAAMGHIELARWADVVVVAPATANFLAKVAHGLADDLLSALCLASQAPLWVAPAMNHVMWAQAATQDNCARLRARGVRFLGPGSGDQACGEQGPGRMVEPDDIVAALQRVVAPGPLAGRRLLLTAGPTREAIDPVRFVSNRSSGKMGYALAVAAREAGAEVVLVSGPVSLDAPPGVECLRVESAADMFAAVMARLRGVDIFIGAAAVADYTPEEPASQKLKKHTETLRLALRRTPDILAAVAASSVSPFTVGFAAETQCLEAHARAKLGAKKLDMIAANQVGQGTGFDSDDNALTVLWPGGGASLGRAPKSALARALMDLIAERYNEKHTN